ncbi:putative quinol monooxygenase [Amycolatopsis sp. NPDC047767]|uniref:putative quinol monooxygenase n=1 Tax=Amycolatopsis sp. NPDC047767 TaxID=3156765 RepID=UPI003453244F
MTVAQIAYIRPKAGKEAEVEQLLRGLVDAARQEEGTLLYLLNKREDEFVFYEMFADLGALKVHSGNDALRGLVARADELLEGGITVEKVSYLDGAGRFN